MPNRKFYGIWNFLNVCGSADFRKIWAIVLKMHTNIIHRWRTFGFEFDQNRLKCLSFLRFWIFWKFSLSCVTCANFELLNSKFVYECINTKWCFIGNLLSISRGLKGSFSCKRGFSLLNFERGLKKNYGLPNLETLCSYYSLLETATVLILCKNIESFLRCDCSKWDMLFSQR